MDVQNVAQEKNYKVLVRCNTYNQSQFIESALNGFAMQITNFPFVCVVIDDCSTDGEKEVLENFIIKECNKDEADYFEDENSSVIILPHSNNKNCTFAFYFLKRNLYKQREVKSSYVKPWQDICLYESLCEGDDYWIDPKKIQKQADFLDGNPEYYLIGSNGIIKYPDISSDLKVFNSCNSTREVTFQELVKKWFFPTASLMFRTALWDVYPKWSKELHFGDDVIVMTSAIHGRVACLGDLTCVYRKGVGITNDLDSKYIYMKEQHMLFYQHLLEDTGAKYSVCLYNKIKKLESELKYYKLKEKSILLTFFLYPKRSIRRLLSRLYRRIVK